MSADADELAKAFGRITFRQIGIVIIACGAVMGAVTATVAGYKVLGGPIPASREFVGEQVQVVQDRVKAEIRSVEANVEVLAESLRQMQQLVLGDKWWRLQEKIEALESEPSTSALRDQIRRLKRDQEDVQHQIDQLD